MKNSFSNNINVVAVVGPTASGKTAFSIELAQRIGGEIVSADSRLVYKGFNIGTAKPSKKEMKGIPHYMIDIVEPEFDYSAALYVDEAKKIINDIYNRGKVPIVVGGTGLYVDVLLKGYNLPRIEADRSLREELGRKTTEELRNILIKSDASAAEVIDPNDKKKIIRAIEVVTISGRSLDDIRSINGSDYNVEWIGKNLPRSVLYERIEKRVDLMLEEGLLEETKSLLSKHGRVPNLINTIGYKEMISYLDGINSFEDAVSLLKRNTRRYAKRQLTWFRRNESIKWDVYPEALGK